MQHSGKFTGPRHPQTNVRCFQMITSSAEPPAKASPSGVLGCLLRRSSRLNVAGTSDHNCVAHLQPFSSALCVLCQFHDRLAFALLLDLFPPFTCEGGGLNADRSCSTQSAALEPALLQRIWLDCGTSTPSTAARVLRNPGPAFRAGAQHGGPLRRRAAFRAGGGQAAGAGGGEGRAAPAQRRTNGAGE